MVRLVTSSRLVPDASLLTLDGDQENQFHLLWSKCKDYQNALVPIDHQDMVSHTLLDIKPSPLPLMVLLVMSLKLVPHASLLTLDGDQENQYQVKCQKIPPLLTLDKMDTMHQKTTFQLIL
jgi:hypothetical protein